MVGILAERPPAELHGGEVLVAQRGHRGCDLVGRVRHQHRRVRADAVPHGRAEQLVDGLAERLALDVPERDVETADRVDRDPAATEVDEAAVHLVPQALDIGRILADQRVAQARRDGVRAGRLHERLDELG